MVISVYGSLDGTAWSATPLMALVLDKDVDPNSIDFIATGVYQFRVGTKRSGSTDTLTSADLAFRNDVLAVWVNACCDRMLVAVTQPAANQRVAVR